MFYRRLQIVVFMRLGSRYIVASVWNECCFVLQLIYTWPWWGKLSLFWMHNSFSLHLSTALRQADFQTNTPELWPSGKGIPSFPWCVLFLAAYLLICLLIGKEPGVSEACKEDSETANTFTKMLVMGKFGMQRMEFYKVPRRRLPILLEGKPC